MKPRNLLPLLLLCAAAQAQPIILPPPGPVETGKSIALRIDGLSTAQCESSAIQVIPAGARAVFQHGPLGGEWLYFRSEAPGLSTVVVQVPQPGLDVIATVSIQVGGDPQPDPFPQPPPGKLAAMVVIEESGDRTIPQSAIYLDQGWRKTLEAAGIEWGWKDPDQPTESGEVPPDLASAIEAARKFGLPAVVCLDEDDRVLSVEGLPTETFLLPDGSEETRPTVKAMRALIEGKVK